MKLDFLVNTELFLTDTCKFCDIVLPACTSFERSELKSYGGGYLYYTKPVIDRLYDSRSDVEILCGLAKALDMDDELLAKGPEACLEYILQDLPITLEELKASDKPVKVPGVEPYVPGTMLEKGLNTASGKFELNIGGEVKVLGAGDGYYVAPDQLHGCVCLEEGILIDTFSPHRADFIG